MSIERAAPGRSAGFTLLEAIVAIVIISVGLDGLPRVLPQVLANIVSMLLGFLIVSNAFKITTELAAAFVAPVFRLP